MEPVYKVIWQILKQPWLTKDSLWMTLPLIFVMLSIYIYFGRNRDEELGWNSAFGNTISLLWICITLWKFVLYHWTVAELYTVEFGRLMILTLLSFWVLILFIFNFFHVVPKQLSYFISNTGSIYSLAYIVIAFVFGNFPFSKNYLIGAFFVFIILNLFMIWVEHIIPMSMNAQKDFEKKEERRKQINALRKAENTRKWNRFLGFFGWKKKE